MPDSFSQLVAEGGGELIGALLIFNRLPARYAHPARLLALAPALGEAAAAKLLACRRLHQALSRQLLDAYGLTDVECWDFPPRRRLALLPPAELARIARHAGAAMHSQSVRHLIARQALERLVARIGADAYAFAVRRAPFLTVPASRPASLDLAAAIESDGLACLGAWLAGEPAAVAKRVALGFVPTSSLERHQEIIADEIGRRTIHLVLKHGDPAWRAYSG